MKVRKAKFRGLARAVAKFQPWDYGFLLDIEIEALKKMRDYIKEKGMHVDAKRDAERINLAIRLLEISTDIHFEWEDVKAGKIYVNTRNIHRFYNGELISKEYLERIGKVALREEKAWYLYCKMREYWLRTWWD